MPDVNNIPDNMRVGGGAGASSMHPIVLALLLATILLIWLLPRRYVVVPFLLTIFLTPFGQQIYTAGAHFFVPRILILCGLIRLVLTKKSARMEITAGGFTSIDRVFLAWAICRAMATFLEFLDLPSVVNQAGFLIDSLGGYFLLRFLIRDEEDVARVTKTFAVIVSILAVTMLNEKLHGQNVFGYLGGRFAPFIRDDAIRSQGSFIGPIPAGTFGATLFCLFVWLCYSGRSRILGIAGMIGSSVMVLTCASSTPSLALPASILGILMWPLRKKMRIVRWGLVILLVSLHLVMKAPVWMLINHISLVGGNSGYHRAMLIDQFVRHFSDWWLIGVKSTASWGWDLWDQANQFVAEGETGGLATFVCFVLLVSWSFGRLGTARKRVTGNRKKEWLCWLLGSALFSYVVSFFGISFSDQSEYGWFALLAIVGVTTTGTLAGKRADDQQIRVAVSVPTVDYRPPSVAGEIHEDVDWLGRKRIPQLVRGDILEPNNLRETS
jgi:hypothetical protein